MDKKLDAYATCSIVEGFCEGTPSEEEQLEAWQYLVDTGGLPRNFKDGTDGSLTVRGLRALGLEAFEHIPEQENDAFLKALNSGGK